MPLGIAIDADGSAVERWELMTRFGTAAALGLLMGLEREWAKSGAGPLFAGVRSFPSIALLGCVSAMVSSQFGVPWFFGAGFLGFAALVVASHMATSSLPSHGTTTEITSLLAFVLGGLCYWGEIALATALTVLVTAILSMKGPLHELARKIEAQDVYATLKFGVIAAVVMPLLPTSIGEWTTAQTWKGSPASFARLDRDHDGVLTVNDLPPRGDPTRIPLEAWKGPPEHFAALDLDDDGALTADDRRDDRLTAWLPIVSGLNPAKVWLLVVFVSGIGLFGYVSAKLLGARRGIALTGVLGGLASSTAVAASMTERSHEPEADRLAPQLALAVVLSSTMMFPRTVIEVLLVDVDLAFGLALPLIGAALFGVLASAYLWFSGRGVEVEEVKIRNPFRLLPALKFGLLFLVMLLVTRFAEDRFDTRGVFFIAAVGGLIDVRPIALSVADLVATGRLALPEAVPAVMIAALANTLLKGGYTAFVGSPALRRQVLPAFSLVIGGGVIATWFVVTYASTMLSWLGL